MKNGPTIALFLKLSFLWTRANQFSVKTCELESIVPAFAAWVVDQKQASFLISRRGPKQKKGLQECNPNLGLNYNAS